MANKPKPIETKWIIFWFLFVILFCFAIGFGVTGLVEDGDAIASDTSAPNLYELTRQTAENTRWIFWLLVFGFAAWSIRAYKTGS